MSYLTLTYTGTLAAGEILEIDGNDKTVELDGVNTPKYFNGNDFPVVFPGTNNVGYEDSGGSRSMKISIIREEMQI